MVIDPLDKRQVERLNVGSIPTGGTKFYAFIAQLVECLSYKEEVIGSSPVVKQILSECSLVW